MASGGKAAGRLSGLAQDDRAGSPADPESAFPRSGLWATGFAKTLRLHGRRFAKVPGSFAVRFGRFTEEVRRELGDGP